MFKELGNLGSFLQKAQEFGQRMKGAGDELRARRAVGTAGGGMVEIEVNGLIEILRCRIDPKLAAQEDRELLEDLLAAAMNDAVTKAKALHAEMMKSFSGGMALPGLDQAIERLLGGNSDGEGPPKPETPDA